MGLFKDAGESIFKYGELIVSKTEGYTKIAKLTYDIKKLESAEGKVKVEMGDYIIKKIEAGDSGIDLNDKEIKDLHKKIEKIRNDISAIRTKIEEHKKSKTSKDDSKKSETSKDESKKSDTSKDDSKK